MKHYLLTLIIVFSGLFLAEAQEQPRVFTHEMSPEEELMRDQIGRDFTPTDPPSAPVRMVAEFEEMQSVLIRYPFGIPMSLIVEMSQDCKVKTIVASAAQQTQVLAQYQSNGVNTANCEWLIAPTDSYWTRDYGPWFVVDGSYEVGISDFPYNRPRPSDDNIPVVLSQQMGFPLYGMNMIQTGGNYMCDGMGIGASTDLVIEENPSMSEEEIADMAEDYLGLRKYHLLPDPLGEYIKHIDCWGKFLDVDKVLIGQVPSTDWRYSDFEFVANFFAMQTSSYGTPYQVFRVYTPGDYPYTPYTNSLILNKKVFVPQTGSQWDDEALEVYEEAMPGYEVVGVMHNTWENTDALHCRAIGIADPNMLHIHHMPLLGQKSFKLNYKLEADVIPYSGAGVIQDSLLIYYRFDGGSYKTTPLVQVSGYHYQATLPFAAPQTEVSYYLKAADFGGHKKLHPFIGEPDPHVFTVKYANDVVVAPDSLIFMTMEEMYNGKSFDIYNFTNGDKLLTEIEHEGNSFFHWYIDPWNLTMPHTLLQADTLMLNVKITIPVDNIAGMLVTDTLDIYSENGLHQVILKVDSDLLSRIGEAGINSSAPRLVKVFPNPFSSSTSIKFELAKDQDVQISVYNMQGQMVETIVSRVFAKGDYTIEWEASSIPEGIYLLKLESENGVDARKLIVF